MTLLWINTWRKTPLSLAIYADPSIVIGDLTKLGGKRQNDWRFGHA